MFECLVGWPPFCADTRQDVYRKSINWQQCLYFPDDVHVGQYSQHLIRRYLYFHSLVLHEKEERETASPIQIPRHIWPGFKLTFIGSSSLVCNSENRLGRTGAHEIKQHPFFHGVDFDNLRRFRAPFEPRLASEIDTTYFPTEDLEIQAANAMDVDDPGAGALQAAPEQQETPEMTLPFIGYTFKRFENNFR